MPRTKVSSAGGAKTASKATAKPTTTKTTQKSVNSDKATNNTAKSAASSKKRKTPDSEDEEEELQPTKKTKGTMSKTGKSATKAKANTKVKRSSGGSVTGSKDSKTASKKKRSAEEMEEDEDDEESVVSKTAKTIVAVVPKAEAASTKKATPSKSSAAKKAVKTPSPKQAAAPKVGRKLPDINFPPTKILHTFVFGEGSQGELGLGAKNVGGKAVIDVQRPRLNPLLEELNIVQLAVGGMHVAALTVDNKIYTWGVNDQGALGRTTTNEGKMRDADDLSDSESDNEDEDSGLNPSEAEPRQVDSAHFPEGTKFAELFAGDSTTFALTTTGLVYGWGTFRGNDGILGFHRDTVASDGMKTQSIPRLITELKNVKKMAIGTNHALALTHKGKAFVWGAGEQSQLGRRVVARTAAGALIPREFGFQRKTIVDIATGDYFSLAVEKDGTVYAWGHNGYGQTGIPLDQNQDDIISVPTKVENLEGRNIQQLAGGNHHTIALTKDGDVLVWGRLDNAQGGMKPEDMLEASIIRHATTNRVLVAKEPLTVPNLKAKFVASGTDTCFAITDDGKAYSWGFSTNYQTGLGTDNEVVEATLVDNSAVKEKQLCFAGVGGQFGVLACEKMEVEEDAA